MAQEKELGVGRQVERRFLESVELEGTWLGHPEDERLWIAQAGCPRCPAGYCCMMLVPADLLQDLCPTRRGIYIHKGKDFSFPGEFNGQFFY